MGGALQPLGREAASGRAESAEEWAWVDRVAELDRLTAEVDVAVEDPRLEEVVSLVRATIPDAPVEAIVEYLQMLDARREERRKLAMRSLIERLPDPRPASLGRRLGPEPSTLAEEIVDMLRHERR